MSFFYKVTLSWGLNQGSVDASNMLFTNLAYCYSAILDCRLLKILVNYIQTTVVFDSLYCIDQGTIAVNLVHVTFILQEK